MPVWRKGAEAQAEWCRKMGLMGGRKRVLKDKKCKRCAKVFRPRSSVIKYCSYKCAVDDRENTHRGKNKKCAVCKKQFYSLPCFLKTSKYCSKKCQQEGLKKPNSWKTKKCKNCGKEYLVRKVQIKHRGSAYCSMNCIREHRHTKFIMKKRKKSTPNAKLKKQLWTYFSQYIRRRDGGVCISCGKWDEWKNTDAGHFIPKTAGLSTYFDERNVNCQCTYCNRYMHGNLSRYALALTQKYGDGILKELDQQRQIKIRISNNEYVEMIEHYKKKINELDDSL